MRRQDTASTTDVRHNTLANCRRATACRPSHTFAPWARTMSRPNNFSGAVLIRMSNFAMLILSARDIGRSPYPERRVSCCLSFDAGFNAVEESKSALVQERRIMSHVRMGICTERGPAAMEARISAARQRQGVVSASQVWCWFVGSSGHFQQFDSI